MKRFIIICLVLLLCAPVYGTPLSTATQDAKIGNFTGPAAGTAQDDNIKASLDILHDRLGSVASGGTTFYVDSGVAGSGGLTRATAVATFQAAVDLCSNNAGDIIVAQAGHAEDIASAAALDFNKAGITVICEGNGEDQPTVSLITAATATVQISAADVFLFNMQILGNFTNGITEALDITADGDGYGIIGCQFRETSNTKELLIMITLTAAADEGLIQGCKFIGIAGGTDSVAINMEGASDQTVISGNHFYGDWSDYVIKNGATSLSMLIKDNVINNLDTGAGKLMSYAAASTGSLINNKCYGNGATFALVGAAMFVDPDNVFMDTEAVVGRNYESMIGAFTGPAAGTAQDDNIKASLDLLNTDTAAIIVDTTAIIANLDGSSTLAGHTYATTMTATSQNDDLFDVAGGAILIKGFTGVVTVAIGAVGNIITIELDADAGFADYDFSTAVETNADIAGSRYSFTDVALSVLTPMEGATGGGSILMGGGWFCGEGMIEQTSTGATTGNIKWYMIWSPYADGTSVTGQ